MPYPVCKNNQYTVPVGMCGKLIERTDAQNFDTKSQISVDFDLHIFQFKIDIVIFGRFLRFKFSQ